MKHLLSHHQKQKIPRNFRTPNTMSKTGRNTRKTKQNPYSEPPTSIRSTDLGMSPVTMISKLQEEPSLNLRVMQSHNPLTVSIIGIAPLIVVYSWSFETETWVKADIEGTLFVTELLPSTLNPSQPRYSLVVLNQHNLENFSYSLKKAELVELVDEDFLSLTEMHDQGRGDAVKNIWGLWVFSDPAAGEGEIKMAEIMKKIMVECAEKVEMGAASAGEDDDVSSEEERGRTRVRQPRRRQPTIRQHKHRGSCQHGSTPSPKATGRCSCSNPSRHGFHHGFIATKQRPFPFANQRCQAAL